MRQARHCNCIALSLSSSIPHFSTLIKSNQATTTIVMKTAICAIAALLSIATFTSAAPPFDGNSKCDVSAFKPDWSKINNCCLKNMGGSDESKLPKRLHCVLPINKEGRFRKCVKDLGYSSVVECVYY
ncbi:hypothetical protein BGX28_003053 [Mortierella sp. GBA30]|nr:hypothetical protein BGX28_003053 [Mortierella sp. GBA30]